MDFRGKTALISGASSGIGAEFARQLHGLGASLVLVARREALLRELCLKLNKLRPDSASFQVCDLTNSVAVEELVRRISTKQVDIFISNAGRGSFGYFENLPIESELDLIRLNILASVRLTHAVIPQMKARRSGMIVNISSIAGIQALPYMATYAATKAFNLQHGLALRHELSEFGVQVINVCPGPVETEFAGVARVPGTPSGASRDPVDVAVSQAIRAMRSNSAIVVPCWRSKCLAFLSSLVPRNFSTWIAGKMLKWTLRKA